MRKNGKLLRVGTPIQLSKLRQLLDALDDAPANATVSHYAGELVVELPPNTQGELQLDA